MSAGAGFRSRYDHPEIAQNRDDKVKSEHLELLYGIIKLLENGNHVTDVGADPDWHEFVVNTYGCLADAPVARGDQGHFERREAMK